MVGSNTETGITVTYEDGDNTLDFVIGTLNQNTTGNAATATALESARTIGGTSFDGTANIVPATITVADTTDTTSYVGLWESATGDLGPKSDAGLTYNAGTAELTATTFVGALTGNVTGDVSGTAATVTGAAQSSITSVGTLTSVVIADAGNIGSASDTDAIAIASNGVVTFSQNPVFPDGGVSIDDLDIDGGTDIGDAIADADLFIIDDGAGGTNRKTAASRLKTYINVADEATALAIVLG